LLYGSSLGSSPDIAQKYKKGDISKTSGGQHTLSRQKTYLEYKLLFTLIIGAAFACSSAVPKFESRRDIPTEHSMPRLNDKGNWKIPLCNSERSHKIKNKPKTKGFIST
jgi:hypothetical protein